MKKITVILLLTLSYSLFTLCKAQTVTIPDANFAAYLNTIIPSAMSSGNQMNTASAAVTSLTRIDVENMGITDLTGVQYFTSLVTLDCGNGSPSADSNHITSLPTLPSTLDTLICGNNQLTSLPSLPNTLTVLKCYINKLTSLPSLPGALLYVDCNHNDITSLPTLPGTLTYVDCSYNQIASLPTLPGALTNFNCGGNQLTNLPALPVSLYTLSCGNNQLTSLPTLPGTINFLYCDVNPLTTLPAVLPAALQVLSCQQDQLTSLPTLPGLLFDLACGDNQLTSLPALPAGLSALDCEFNQLTSLPSLPNGLYELDCSSNNISCFPLFPKTLTDSSRFNLSPNPFTCLPNYVPAMNPGVLEYPLCSPGNANGCISAEGIVGYAYKDMNSNCIKDVGDSALADVSVKLYDNNNNLLSQTYTAINGVYDFPDTDGTYTVMIDTAGMPFIVQCTHPGADSVLTLNGIDSNVNFSLTCKSGFDVGVQSVAETGLVFPGLQHDLSVVAGDISHRYNLGCASGVSGTVQITVSGPVTYVGPGVGALTPTVSGNVFTYTIADYSAINNNSAFNLLFNTNTSAQAGDNICVNVSVSPATGDNDTLNNTYQYCYSVVNSHDPNSKEVYPVNVVPGYEGWLIYTVHFQNTGSAAANNILLTDTLDNNLDVSTFQLLNYSSQNTVSLTGNVLIVRFAGVNLPDSAISPTGSTGFVQYRIKPKANTSDGSSIKNTAYVYFDYNAPVITDTTRNMFTTAASVDNITTSSNNIEVYPNPNNGIFTVFCHSVLPQAGEESLPIIQVYNVLGQQVLTETLRSGQGNNSIDLGNQPNGVYMYRVISESGALMGEGKVVIEK